MTYKVKIRILKKFKEPAIVETYTVEAKDKDEAQSNALNIAQQKAGPARSYKTIEIEKQ